MKFSGGNDSSTISAKPQIRNIRAELTKFVPTAVKIHRNLNKPSSGASASKPRSKPSATSSSSSTTGNVEAHKKDVNILRQNQQQEPTKDDIYAKFMQEMGGFL